MAALTESTATRSMPSRALMTEPMLADEQYGPTSAARALRYSLHGTGLRTMPATARCVCCARALEGRDTPSGPASEDRCGSCARGREADAFSVEELPRTPRISRASAAVATGRPTASHSARARSTSSAFDLAYSPG